MTDSLRATVIIPTFGYAPFLRCAIESVQAQTVRDIEICVILDGSPASMKDFVDGLAARDGRIRVFTFPKAARTGEIHRAKVLPQTKGRIICYLSHDDLWFPSHVERMERQLAEADFAHSIHVDMGLGDAFGVILDTLFCDLSHPETLRRMLHRDCPINYLGLSCAAHTRDAYFRLAEGWTVTPDGLPSDLYMWRKFLRDPSIRTATMRVLSGLHFPAPLWTVRYSPEEFEKELDRYVPRLREPEFQEMLFCGVLQGSITRLLDQDVRITELMNQLTQREMQLPLLLEVESGKRIRELPARKIWKLIWKRLTRQYGHAG